MRILFTLHQAISFLQIMQMKRIIFYRLYNKKTKRIVSAKSNLIHELNLDIPPSKPMGFYSTIPNPVVLPLEKSQTTVNWYHSKNGRYLSNNC